MDTNKIRFHTAAATAGKILYMCYVLFHFFVS